MRHWRLCSKTSLREDNTLNSYARSNWNKILYFLCSLALFSAARAGEADITNDHPEPARTKGWSWKLPPDHSQPQSEKRNNVFYVGEPVVFKLEKASVKYEVRDFWGTLVDKGAASPATTINVKTPGWYKLYVYGNETRKEWGDVVGGTTFVIFRQNPNFPPLPGKDFNEGAYYPSMDETMRGVTGMGPQRHAVKDASKADEAIKQLEAAIATDKKLYIPFDPLRKRALMIAFPNGTKDLAGVKKIVEHFKDDVQYWEPRNEPNFGSNGTDFAEKEMKPFFETVKGVDPKLKVMGPGTVSVGPQLLPWLDQFFKAGGGKYIDVFSFHCYNNVNGDVWLARKSLDQLNALLSKYNADKLEKWQTEQGYFCAVYGDYQPHLQGRWEMVQMMVYEQYGIPKEHNHLWYDKSHGFWDVPTWWESDDGSLNPAAPLMRVWSEELFGANFAKAYDFGPIGNKLYVASLFSGPGKSVAAFMSAGSTDGQVELSVSGGGDKLHVVSAFGVEQDIPVKDGHATLAVPEIPVYVELAQGQTIEVSPMDWGSNLAMAPGVIAKASGTGEHPADKSIKNDIAKIHNGVLENWYYTQQKESQPWMDNTKEFPAWVELDLPKPTPVERVVIYACPPWQWQGTLQDYELQYDDNGKWVTLEHVQEPLRTFAVFTPPNRTTVDSFFSDRWIFQHHFKPVTTQKIRIFVYNTTFGGGAMKISDEAGGQTGPHQIDLREIEIYGPPDPVMTSPTAEPAQAYNLQPLKLNVGVTRHDDGKFSGKVVPHLPAGWNAAPESIPVEFEKKGDHKTIQFTLTPAKNGDAGLIALGADVLDAAGKTIDSGSCYFELLGPVEMATASTASADGPVLEATLKSLSGSSEKGTLTLSGERDGKTITQEKTFELDAAGAPLKVSVPLKDFDLAGRSMAIAFEVRCDSGVKSLTKQTLSLTPYRYIGPFSNKDKKGFAAVYPPETELNFGKTYPTEDGPGTWKKGLSASTGFFNFEPCFKQHDWIVGYAVTYVQSPSDQEAVLSCGSDDGIKAWVNGKEAIADDAYRGASPGQDNAKITLKKGWNTVLAKVTQGTYGFGFYLSIVDSNGAPVPDLKFSDTGE